MDDDEDILDNTSSLLELFGYSSIIAKNGQEAISLYNEHHPDLVFMDVKMPKKDGYETFFDITERFPKAKIIFMTAHADDSQWQKAKKKKAIALIEKPYSAEQLKKLVKLHIGSN